MVRTKDPYVFVLGSFSLTLDELLRQNHRSPPLKNESIRQLHLGPVKVSE
jgi:hypothetical protein